MDHKEIGKRLKKARLEAGLTQEHLANLLDIPISGVSVLESGHRKLDILELLKIADFYSKPPEWFYCAHNPKEKRRWYDKNAVTEEAFELLRAAPTKFQLSVAHAIIGFLKNGELVEVDE